jgi:hypothetical protein
MKKFIISEEERSRILSLHEGFKNTLLNEQSSGASSKLQIKYIGDTPNVFPSYNTSRHINVQKSDGTYQVFKLEGEKDINKLDKEIQLINFFDGGKPIPAEGDKGSNTGQSWVFKLNYKPGNYKMVIEYIPNIPDSIEEFKIETNVSTKSKSNTPVTETPPTGDTQNRVNLKTPKSQASIDWGKGEVKGPVIGKIYSASVVDPKALGNKAIEIQIKISKIQKNSTRDGSWLGYYMWVVDAKTNEQLEGIDIDCNSINKYLNSSPTWVDISAYGPSELKWYFNKEFLQDLKQTLGCK